ncbi:hypothetical protein PFMALIP_05880 [Plasmodium falciparum MaliPS096_E11]|uniref:Uncharacterized protein n=1 Tax=Plasmodium falciparum MaliPS096_E11 TaxID=1036727 RepID=A0A024WHQ4_PLAFA|nr:hypothetical protein PFMALIP_05880 [Plasmodium falciparum MaliPS096_E11]
MGYLANPSLQNMGYLANPSLQKLQDYLNTAVVNKHSKVDDTQRQIILTLQLAKLREGAYKYYKSFSKNSSSIFDEEIN